VNRSQHTAYNTDTLIGKRARKYASLGLVAGRISIFQELRLYLAHGGVPNSSQPCSQHCWSAATSQRLLLHVPSASPALQVAHADPSSTARTSNSVSLNSSPRQEETAAARVVRAAARALLKKKKSSSGEGS